MFPKSGLHNFLTSVGGGLFIFKKMSFWEQTYLGMLPAWAKSEPQSVVLWAASLHVVSKTPMPGRQFQYFWIGGYIIYYIILYIMLYLCIIFIIKIISFKRLQLDLR